MSENSVGKMSRPGILAPTRSEVAPFKARGKPLELKAGLALCVCKPLALVGV